MHLILLFAYISIRLLYSIYPIHTNLSFYPYFSLKLAHLSKHQSNMQNSTSLSLNNFKPKSKKKERKKEKISTYLNLKLINRMSEKSATEHEVLAAETRGSGNQNRHFFFPVDV